MIIAVVVPFLSLKRRKCLFRYLFINEHLSRVLPPVDFGIKDCFPEEDMSSFPSPKMKNGNMKSMRR